MPDAVHLPPGTGVIFRHYGTSDRAALAAHIAQHCRNKNVPLLIAGDWRLALSIDAAGVHLPEYHLSRPHLWRRAKPGWIVTAAAHNQAALIRADKAGADAVLLSPVFPTQSHPGAKTLGAVRFAALANTSPLTVYALGGMTPAHLQRLSASRIDGWAGIGAWT